MKWPAMYEASGPHDPTEVNNMGQPKYTTEERFWAKVYMPPCEDDCWTWTASNTLGYGLFWSGIKMVLAHKYSYGITPDGLVLDHLCRNHACVNPSHLEPVTQRENLRRGVGWAGVNAAKTHCPQGHEYTFENTCWRNGTRRSCRACDRRRPKRNRIHRRRE